MLTLSKFLTLNAETIASPNLCDQFEKDDLARIGEWCSSGYKQDKQSRAKWEKRTEAAMDLAMQIQKAKTFPWPNCSNVAFPLVTIAALQFHAMAYPSIISGTEVVKMRVIGPDVDGSKTARAHRISCYMSYQVLEEDTAWEEQQDRVLISVPVVGVAFKKSYYSNRLGHNVSELVMAKDLVLDYWAKSVDTCPRKTHVIPHFRNEIHEKVLRGSFRDVLDEAWYKGRPQVTTTTQQTNADNRAGIKPPAPDETTPFQLLEQHCSLDLDGDGYAEPYIITFEENTQCVLRIVTRFDREIDIERVVEGAHKGEIISINATEYFTKVPFIPSPDGGIMDIGFGVFLGPLNESVNTLVNQLIDAGTMGTTAGGFLGRGAKIRGGVYTFAPFGWARVDSTGDDLRKSIFPLPVREPSPVLFQLLSLLIEYANRIPGTTELSVGENIGQNTPASTAQTMLSQGRKIYTAVFKRIWRSMKEEFKKLYRLNGIYLPDRKSYGSAGNQITREDFLGDSDAVVPAADPNVTSDSDAMAQVILLKQSAASTPGYNKDEVERRFLKVMKIDGIDQVFPGSDKVPQGESEKVTIEKLKQEGKAQELKAENLRYAAGLLEDRRINDAKIQDLEAQAVALMANIEGDKEDRQIAMINAQIGMARSHSDHILGHLDRVLKHLEIQVAAKEASNAARAAA